MTSELSKSEKAWATQIGVRIHEKLKSEGVTNPTPEQIKALVPWAHQQIEDLAAFMLTDHWRAKAAKAAIVESVCGTLEIQQATRLASERLIAHLDAEVSP